MVGLLAAPLQMSLIPLLTIYNSGSLAFVSIAAPVFVFFALQKYLVRGLLAGSVK